MIEISREFEKRFWPLLVSGKSEMVIDTVFSISDAQAAHEYVKNNRNIGKVVLRIQRKGR